MSMQPADLAMSGLTKSYGTAMAVDGVTLRIAAGELVALLGPSGCGKTTTLRMIAGLVEPTAGDILVNGRQITRVPVHRRNIGMLFQNYALFPHLSIAQNVAFGLEMRGMKKAEIQRRVKSALEMVQLGAYADRVPAALSGGQQQRVALARALVIEPSLLLLDEPLGALDKNLRENMQVELRRIQQRLGITAVLVTHDQDEAMVLADRIVIMRDGKLEQVGTPQEVYSRPATRFVAGFMGVSNFFRGEVTSTQGRQALVRLRSGGQALLEGDYHTGDTVLISVRPEAVQIEPGSAPDMSMNAVTAVVEQVIYKGQGTHFYLRLSDGEEVVAYVANREGGPVHASGVAAGATVHASWPASSNKVVLDN